RLADKRSNAGWQAHKLLDRSDAGRTQAICTTHSRQSVVAFARIAPTNGAGRRAADGYAVRCGPGGPFGAGSRRGGLANEAARDGAGSVACGRINKLPGVAERRA